MGFKGVIVVIIRFVRDVYIGDWGGGNERLEVGRRGPFRKDLIFLMLMWGSVSIVWL